MENFGFIKMGYLKHVLAASVVIVLSACSGGDGGIGGGSAGSAALSWKAPVVREDGTDLPLIQIAGYRIYYGLEAGKYLNKIDIDDGLATEGQLTNIPKGTYFVVMTTIDIDGAESVFSPEVKVLL